MAAFMVGYGLFEMPWGSLGDRVGVRHILAAIMLGGSLLTAGLALVDFLPRGTSLSEENRGRTAAGTASGFFLPPSCALITMNPFCRGCMWKPVFA